MIFYVGDRFERILLNGIVVTWILFASLSNAEVVIS